MFPHYHTSAGLFSCSSTPRDMFIKWSIGDRLDSRKAVILIILLPRSPKPLAAVAVDFTFIHILMYINTKRSIGGRRHIPHRPPVCTSRRRVALASRVRFKGCLTDSSDITMVSGYPASCGASPARGCPSVTCSLMMSGRT